MKNLQAVVDRMQALAEEHDQYIARGQKPPLRVVQNLLVAYRMYARACTEMHNDCWGECRRLKHKAAQAEHDGITFLPAKARLEGLHRASKQYYVWMANAGEGLMILLNWWQDAGATYDDLLRFCGADYPGMRAMLRDFYNGRDEIVSFSDLVFVNNLDYKNPRETGWIEDEVDAPLTHCIKAAWSRRILTNPAASAVASAAAEAVFPEIWENALTMHTNEDGEREMYDKDGVLVVNLDKEE